MYSVGTDGPRTRGINEAWDIDFQRVPLSFHQLLCTHAKKDLQLHCICTLAVLEELPVIVVGLQVTPSDGNPELINIPTAQFMFILHRVSFQPNFPHRLCMTSTPPPPPNQPSTPPPPAFTNSPPPTWALFEHGIRKTRSCTTASF